MTYQRDYERQVKKLQAHIAHRSAFYGILSDPMIKATETLNNIALVIPKLSNTALGRKQLNASLKASFAVVYRF